MIKKIFKVLKKVIMAAVLLYAYNKFAVSLNATIPINYITISLVTFLGIPAIVGLVLFSIFMF